MDIAEGMLGGSGLDGRVVYIWGKIGGGHPSLAWTVWAGTH